MCNFGIGVLQQFWHNMESVKKNFKINPPYCSCSISYCTVYCISMGGGGASLESQWAIDKLYTQMGKADRLRNRVEPFAALFWALGIVPHPACQPGITASLCTKHVLIWS